MISRRVRLDPLTEQHSSEFVDMEADLVASIPQDAASNLVPELTVDPGSSATTEQVVEDDASGIGIAIIRI